MLVGRWGQALGAFETHIRRKLCVLKIGTLFLNKFWLSLPLASCVWLPGVTVA